MAVANLHETLLFYTLRKNSIEDEITKLNGQKILLSLEQADVNSLKSAGISALRSDFRKLFESDPDLQEKYLDYTEIPGFQEEMDKINAQFAQYVEEISQKETAMDTQITTYSTELEEIKAYEDSFKNMLSNNIQKDYDHALK